jgi:pathogenesis-related protein 1
MQGQKYFQYFIKVLFVTCFLMSVTLSSSNIGTGGPPRKNPCLPERFDDAFAGSGGAAEVAALTMFDNGAGESGRAADISSNRGNSLADSVDLVGSPVAASETGRLVGMTAAHNAVRARTEGSVNGPMPPLTWSTDLASKAEVYAKKLAKDCFLKHSGAKGLGENLARFEGQKATPAMVVETWARELRCYTYGPFGIDDCTLQCALSNGCGHYTQIIWRNTTQVGCGVAVCGRRASYQEMWVCMYKPTGNYLGQYPY